MTTTTINDAADTTGAPVTTNATGTGIETGTDRLLVLAGEIRVALAGTLQKAIEAGERLIEAKALVPHGSWLPWLREHCGIGERTAQRFMRLAEHKEALHLKSDTMSVLTMREAFRLLDDRTGHQSPSLARPAEEAAPVSPAPTTFTAAAIEADIAELTTEQTTPARMSKADTRFLDQIGACVGLTGDSETLEKIKLRHVTAESARRVLTDIAEKRKFLNRLESRVKQHLAQAECEAKQGRAA